MPRVPLALAAADRMAVGLPEKLAVNVYAEPDPTNPGAEMAMRETPGSLSRASFASAVRGMWQMDGHAGGKVLVPHGAVMATFDPATNTTGTLTGVLPGSDRADWAFAELVALGLFDGKLYWSDGATVRPCTDGVTSGAALAIGSTTTNVASGAFTYSIAGTAYSKGVVTAGTAPGNDVVPVNKFGAVAFDIGADGVIDAIEAPANVTGYATATAAVEALPVSAVDHVRMGYVTAKKSDGAFTFGTTALNAANTTVAYTSTAANTGFTDLLAEADETAFTSVAMLGQRGLFTFGNRFGYTDAVTAKASDITGTSALNWYTAESSPDFLVAGRVLGEVYILFGTRTLEVWTETGDNDDPFQVQSGLTEETGCACRDGIVRADNSLFWVDEAFNVRRWAAGGSPIVSEPWVSARLKSAGAANIQGMTYQDRGHLFVMWRTPERCMAYDVLTRRWHTRQSLAIDTWRYTSMATAGSRVFVADGDGKFAELGDAYHSEHMPDATTLGTEIVREFVAVAPLQSGDPEVTSVRLESSRGAGLAIGQGVDPQIMMAQSRDGGATWSSERSRSLGRQGEYAMRVIWRRNGRMTPPNHVFRFRKSDPVRTIYTGVVINEDA